MSHITRFEKDQFSQLRAEIDAALKIVSNKYGLVFHAGNVKYESHTAEFKLHVSTLTEGGEVIHKEAEDFKCYATLYGLKPKDLGRKYLRAGQVYTIIGCKPLNRTYPILVSCTDGKRYKISADSAITFLKLYEVK